MPVGEVGGLVVADVVYPVGGPFAGSDGLAGVFHCLVGEEVVVEVDGEEFLGAFVAFLVDGLLDLFDDVWAVDGALGADEDEFVV